MNTQWINQLVEEVVAKQNAETKEIAMKQEFQHEATQKRFKALIELREQSKPIFVEALTSAFTGGGNGLPATSRVLQARLRGQRDIVGEKISHLHLNVPQPKLDEQLMLEKDLRDVVLARTFDGALTEAMVANFASQSASKGEGAQR